MHIRFARMLYDSKTVVMKTVVMQRQFGCMLRVPEHMCATCHAATCHAMRARRTRLQTAGQLAFRPALQLGLSRAERAVETRCRVLTMSRAMRCKLCEQELAEAGQQIDTKGARSLYSRKNPRSFTQPPENIRTFLGVSPLVLSVSLASLAQPNTTPAPYLQSNSCTRAADRR
jgi:hypothetical protein